jgi:hypothetical protein
MLGLGAGQGFARGMRNEQSQARDGIKGREPVVNVGGIMWLFDRAAEHEYKTDIIHLARFTLKDIPFCLYGILFLLLGLAMYSFGEFVSIIRLLLRLGEPFRSWNQAIVWYSGMPFALGLLLAAADLVLFLPSKRRSSLSRALVPIADRHVVVALTAYNDESSIADAVADFRAHPLVKKIIVVENNSSDQTAAIARAAGAVVVTEMSPGYGRCVYRCFQEALTAQDQELIVLSRGT